MNLLRLAIVLFLFWSAPAWAQEPHWAWMGGLNHRAYLGYHGTRTVPAPQNWPGGRSGSAAWFDNSGRLVLLGGASPSGPSSRSDLWRYNPATGYWVWLNGSAALYQSGVYGERGTPGKANTPGASSGAASWKDAQGRLWFFGGDGTDGTGTWGLLNAMWVWDPAINQWAWVRGSPERDQPGLYGVKGQGDASTKPGSRRGATAWTDASGRLWLFGGEGYDDSGNWGVLNDLWRFDPGTSFWTWIGGSTTANPPGVYGVQGTPAPANTPGGRSFAAGWTDPQGRFWLYGGGSPYWLVGDLWRYDPVLGQWAWIKGDGVANTTAVHGTPGIPAPGNTPGGRAWASAWSDRAGRLYLWGGQGIAADGHRAAYGELWRYDPLGGSWAWLTSGEAPEARWQAMAWTDAFGQFWLFGGERMGTRDSWERLNDLWRYDPATQVWTRVGGVNLDRKGIYGTPGAADPGNTPGARRGAASWVGNDGFFWLMGGWGHDYNNEAGLLNDLWRMDPETRRWTWVRGSDATNAYGIYRPQGSETRDGEPGCRRDATAWTDPAGRLWIFGGFGGANASVNFFFNDLWRYNPATGNWAWMKGSFESNGKPYYGASGVQDSGFTPGARQGAADWIDAAGRLWLMGGEGIDSEGVRGPLGDLWRFDPEAGAWAWIKGDVRRNRAGVYGRQGVAEAAAMPGGRQGAAAWIDRQGRLCLFGGWGLDSAGGLGYLADLWRYDFRSGNWAWLGGPTTAQPAGVYGNGPGAWPGGRMKAVTWVDPGGRLCLSGGQGLDGAGAAGMLEDLWRYEPASGVWNWIGGASSCDAPGYYGQPGLAAAGNTPGGRAGAAFWTDPLGQVWMFGGESADNISGSPALMDLWRLSGTSGSRREAWEKLE